MKKVLLVSLLLVAVLLLAGGIIGCSDNSVIKPVASSQFAFIRIAGSTSLAAHMPRTANIGRATDVARHVGRTKDARKAATLTATAGTVDIAPGTDSIVTMKNDGTGEQVPADHAGVFYAVQLSYDGTMAVFTAEDSAGNVQIFVVDMTKSPLAPVQITTDAEYHSSPQLSFDGKQIVFTRWDTNAGNPQVAIVSSSGGSETTITNAQLAQMEVFAPTFTPDGKIVFEEDYTDNLYIMNADGSGVTQLTNLGSDRLPSVSADGKQIILAREDNSGENIYAMDINGQNAKLLTTDAAVSGNSTDPLIVNDRIVFVVYGNTSTNFTDEIYSMKLDGTDVKRLTTNTVYDYFNDDWY